MSQWFLLLDNEPLAAAENMARDEYLFDYCHTQKAGFFRLYAWQVPTFSFGVSQKIHKAIDVDYIEKSGCAYVRRITGGKTVLHQDEITYAVVSSEDIFYKEHDLYQSYKVISGILVDAFNRIGIKACLSGGSPAHLAKSSQPCFSFLTPNEIEINGKKIVGSAQKRDNRALLQHGSIPIKMDYRLYALGSRTKAEFLQRRMTTLSDVSNRSRQELGGALVTSFQSFLGEPLKEFEFAEDEKQKIVQIAQKYRSKEWNFSH